MTKITREYVREHPEKIFVFGDNVLEKGFGGQAKELRGEPNAYGVPTKKYPSMRAESFFTDTELMANILLIDRAIAKIPTDGREIVVLPLGTGLAQLPIKAPETYSYLVKRIKTLTCSGFVNQLRRIGYV